MRARLLVRSLSSISSLVFLIFCTGCTLGDNEVDDSVHSARCRVRCLSLAMKNNYELSLMADTNQLISVTTCLQDTFCEQCIQPCNRPYSKLSDCETYCTEQGRSCEDSCRFLDDINTTPLCSTPPSTWRSSDLPAVCDYPCDEGQECDRRLRCCQPNCGWICQRHHTHEITETGEEPMVREKVRSSSAEIHWNLVQNQSVPLIYLLESRSISGRKFQQTDISPWQQISQITTTSASSGELVPGFWYQFRVTAVGTEGVISRTKPSLPFRLSREPRRPSAPTNLTEGDTLFQGGKMSVAIYWFPPQQFDLPISRYKVYWSKTNRRGSSSSSKGREHKQILPGDQHVFQIPHLDPDSTYTVQIQTISFYGNHKLRSDKAELNIITFPLPDSVVEKLNLMTSSSVAPTPSAPVSLRVGVPFYHNGILKANVSWHLINVGLATTDKVSVSWVPEACIADRLTDNNLSTTMTSVTQKNHFLIYDLRFGCRYVIRVQSLSDRGLSSDVISVVMTTPSCVDVRVRGRIRPDCSIYVPHIPEAPSGLRYSFFISNSNITATLVWDPVNSEVPIVGYNVEWGPVDNPLMSDFNLASTISRTFVKETTAVQLGGLIQGMTYQARVTAVTELNLGKAALIQFSAPIFTQPIQDKNDVIESDESEMSRLFDLYQQPRPDHPHSQSSRIRSCLHTTCLCLVLVILLSLSKIS